MRKMYAVVEIKLKTEVVFEHDEEDGDVTMTQAGFCAIQSLGLQLDDGVQDWTVLEMDYAHDDAPITPMPGDGPIHKYLSASFALQDLLSQQDSGVIINGRDSDPEALSKVRKLSSVMWEARKEMTGDPVEAPLSNPDDYDDETPF